MGEITVMLKCKKCERTMEGSVNVDGEESVVPRRATFVCGNCQPYPFYPRRHWHCTKCANHIWSFGFEEKSIGGPVRVNGEPASTRTCSCCGQERPCSDLHLVSSEHPAIAAKRLSERLEQSEAGRPIAEQARLLGNTLHVEFWYPPYAGDEPKPSPNVHDVRIELVAVRGSDEIHVRFDYDRNGFVVSRYVEYERSCVDCIHEVSVACDAHSGERLREEAFVGANREQGDAIFARRAELLDAARALTGDLSDYDQAHQAACARLVAAVEAVVSEKVAP